MGILDDAIREHLDLKRQHGAEDSEVKQLEDEAFGPPTRPGEPDFPESQEQPAVGAQEADPSAVGAGSEDATTVMGSSAATEAPAATPEPTPAAPSETIAETPPQVPPETVPESPPEAPTEPPDEGPVSPPEPPSEPAPEPALGAPGLFDQASETEQPPPPEAEPSHQPPPEAEPPERPPPEPPVGEEEARITPLPEPVAEEHPIAAMETVEHPMEELLAEEAAVDLPQPDAPATGETDVVDEEGDEEHLSPPPPATGEEPAVEPPGQDDAEEEDVLEETPEFLRDQPEDDELWFEQGEPKDFDF